MVMQFRCLGSPKNAMPPRGVDTIDIYAGADRGDAIRRCLFLLFDTIHAIISHRARAGLEIRSLPARIHAALSVSGCLFQ